MNNMIRKFALVFFILLPTVTLSTSLQAQEIKTVFKSMPDSLCLLLTAVNRADFVDFIENKMKARVENRLGGQSEMTELGKDYLCVQLTAQTSLQMKLLALNDTTRLVCTVYTACAPVCDSNIRFYTTDWKEIPGKEMLTLPEMKAYLTTSDSTDAHAFNAALRGADLLLQMADFKKEGSDLTFTLTTPRYMEQEMAEKLKAYIRPSLVYRWKEGRFLSDL